LGFLVLQIILNENKTNGLIFCLNEHNFLMALEDISEKRDFYMVKLQNFKFWNFASFKICKQCKFCFYDYKKFRLKIYRLNICL